MPSPRYTVRLPEPLHTQVQVYLETTRTPFVALRREALSAYLADKMPTGVPTFADSTDPLTALQAHVTELTARVKVIEGILTTWSPYADSHADSEPTGADTPAPRRPGRPSSPLRQQILDLLQAHPAGLSAEAIRVHIQARRPIGDTLQGLQRAGLIRAQGRGAHRVIAPS